MSALEKTLRWIVLASVFGLPFVPLIVADGVHMINMFFPYITGKNFAFRIIVELMASAWLALALVSPAYRPKRSWILGALALFVLIIAIADVQGVNPGKSIWSNYERMDGLVTLVHLLVYTMVAAAMMHTERIWRWLFRTSLAVSAYLSVYGFLQIAGYSALGGGGTGSLTARIDATFGNPIYLAAYMLFHVFIAAMLWSQEWSERRPGARLPMSLMYGFIIVLDTLTLLFTGTRGTTIGLAGGALLTALLMLLQGRDSRIAWRISMATLVSIVVLAAGIWAARDSAWVHKVGFIGRLATISTEDSTVKARFINWSIAWKGVQERPFLGWGQENFAIVFDKYYDPRMYAQEPWFDRVHNIVFDWLIAGGFLGLLSYMLVFITTLLVLWKRSFTVAERSILTGLIAAYLCHNFFVFDNVTSYILFGTILAYVIYRAGEGEQHLIESELLPRAALPYTMLAGILVAAIVIPWANLNAISANVLLLKALGREPGGIMQNLKDFEDSIALNTFGVQEAREQLAQASTQVGAAQGIPLADREKFVTVGITQMQAQAKVSPLDARFPLFLGAIYNSIGDYTDGAVALQKAHELSPAKQSIYFEMANNAQHRGDTATALAMFKTAFELEQAYKDARFYYAAALIQLGREAEAEQLIAPLAASGEAADQRILAAYVAKKEYAKAIPLWHAKIAANPQSAQSYFTLAAIYYQMGDRAGAIATLQAAEKALPEVVSQTGPLIQQIQNGTVQM